MKKLLFFSLLLCCLAIFGFTSSSTNTTSATTTLTVQNLSKKWVFEKYTFLTFAENPSEKEKKDYIHLSSNKTFTSISEGKYEKGNWKLNANKKRILLSKKNEKGNLTFIVDELTNNKLVLIIDDFSDEDAQYLKIHFKN
jgi:hypothetical protein